MAMKITPAMRQAAKQAVAGYVRELAEKVPVGTKVAEAQRNASASNRLTKLAQHMSQGKDLFSAVATVFGDKNAAYRHQIVQNLARGLQQKLASKQASLGASKHPSASLTGLTITPGSNQAASAPASQSIKTAKRQ